MNEVPVYVAIVAACVAAGLWFYMRVKVPPEPTHLEDLEAELRQAQRDGVAELKLAEKSAAMSEVYNSRVRWLKQEIEHEEHRIRTAASGDGRLDIPSAISRSGEARA